MAEAAPIIPSQEIPTAPVPPQVPAAAEVPQPPPHQQPLGASSQASVEPEISSTALNLSSSHALTPSTSAPSLPHPTPAPPPPASEPTSPFDDPTSDAARAARSASQWNGLLRWARGVRLEGGSGGVGGGWDWASGGYHVPRDSPQYWSGRERAPLDPSAPPPPRRPTTITPSALHVDEDDDNDEQQENAYGRPRRRAAAVAAGKVISAADRE
ncbi:hypothetical protein JCM11251_003454 [Rhodosporidiobolus azoricus]